MIIHQINVVWLVIVKPKNNAPVAGHINGPKLRKLALHGMQPQPGKIHIGRLFAGIKPAGLPGCVSTSAG
jgi:hypothetical protein